VKTRRTEININQPGDINCHVGQPHTRQLGEDKKKPLPGKGYPIDLDVVDAIIGRRTSRKYIAPDDLCIGPNRRVTWQMLRTRTWARMAGPKVAKTDIPIYG